jgi:DNA-binding transcriptional ArsR family regulator
MSDEHPPGGAPAGRARREITDARTMRALAHPMRIALLELLRREGELTASRAAELLNDSPGNMSWHLQTLAKYGFVEEAGGGRGRSRPWRVVTLSIDIKTALSNDPEQVAASDAVEATFREFHNMRLQEWGSQRHAYSDQWRQAAFYSGAVTYLTAEEMDQLSHDVTKLLEAYSNRTGPGGERPPDALPVQFVAYGHPLPPTTGV